MKLLACVVCSVAFGPPVFWNWITLTHSKLTLARCSLETLSQFLGLTQLCCCCFAFVFQDRVSLHSPCCPGTCSVDQAGPELRDPPASTSQVLGLMAWATTAWFKRVCLFLFILHNFYYFRNWIALKEFCSNVNFCKVHSFYSKNMTFSKNEFTKKL